jgi:hypothetical protein
MFLKRLKLWFKKPLVSYLITDQDVYERWTDSQRLADDGLVLVIRSDVKGVGIVYYRFSDEPFDGSDCMKYMTTAKGGAVYVHNGYQVKVLLDKKYRRMFGYYPSRIYLKRIYE